MESLRPEEIIEAVTPTLPEEDLLDTAIATTASALSEKTVTKPELSVVEEMKESISAKPVKKKKVPKARELEEIKELPISKLTDKEKEHLIKALKEENTEQLNKNQSLKNNCEMAFEKLRSVEAQYNSMENYYLTKLKFIGEQIQACHNAIAMAIKGGIQ